MDQPSPDLGVLTQGDATAVRKRLVIGVLAAGILLVTVLWVVIARAATRRAVERAAAESVKANAQELWTLSGLDLTKLAPAEYSEVKLAEPNPERLRTILLHLADDRARYWTDRIQAKRASGNRSEAEDQVLTWQRNIYQLQYWRPGLPPEGLGELRRKGLEFALNQEHLRLQQEIEQLKAAK